MLVKNRVLCKFIKLTDSPLKSGAHFKYKQYRNMLSTFLKTSKQSCVTNYFQIDINLVSANLTNWSNTLKQFVGCCRRIV